MKTIPLTVILCCAGSLDLSAQSTISDSYAAGYTQANISFTSVPTRNYRLEYDGDLAGPWTDSALGTFPPTGSLTSKTLTSLGTAPSRLFRAVAMPLPTAP